MRDPLGSRVIDSRSLEVPVADLTLRRSFITLHLTLGLVIIFESVPVLVHALGAPAQHVHLAMLGGVETVAALLFLWS